MLMIGVLDILFVYYNWKFLRIGTKYIELES